MTRTKANKLKCAAIRNRNHLEKCKYNTERERVFRQWIALCQNNCNPQTMEHQQTEIHDAYKSYCVYTKDKGYKPYVWIKFSFYIRNWLNIVMKCSMVNGTRKWFYQCFSIDIMDV